MGEKIGAWLGANWKPMAFTVGVVALYVIGKVVPDSTDEQELLYAILAAWGVFGGFVPRFAKPKSEE